MSNPSYWALPLLSMHAIKNWGRLKEGSAREAILHEAGHAALGLMDIVDPTNFMYFDTGTTDYRLHSCSKKGRYDPENENQWETIPHPALEKNT